MLGIVRTGIIEFPNRLIEADIDLQQMGSNSRNIVTVVHVYMYNSVINYCRTKWINDVRRENARQGFGKKQVAFIQKLRK